MSLQKRYQNYLLYHGLFCTGHKPDPAFLDWFVGFCEGDGSFSDSLRSTRNLGEFCLSITQKDRKPLDFIQQNLQFGKVYPDNKNIHRLVFRKREYLLLFIVLVNGNFRLQTRQQVFQEWATRFLEQYVEQMKNNLINTNKKVFPTSKVASQDLAKLYKNVEKVLSPEDQKWYSTLLYVSSTVVLNPTTQLFDFETPWFSGFLQAEGCFLANFYLSEKASLGYKLIPRISFRQNDAEKEFKQVKALLNGSASVVSEGESWRLTLSSKKALTLFCQLLEKYPLHGWKKVAHSRWLRILKIRDEKKPLPQKETLQYHRFLRLVQAVNECRKQEI